jgi:tetratricopeptide (TPR) repeat protein
LADVYMRRQQWGVARKALESALVIRPDAPGVVILLARVHLELGEPEEVVRYLKPIAPGPMRDFLLKNEQAAKLRIRAYEMLGQLDEARKENERLPQDKPEDVVRRAFLLQAEGQAKKAEDLLKEALDQDPENAELLVAIVQFYVSNNQLEQGQALVQQRLAKDPGNLLYRRLEVLVMPAQGEDAARDAKILEILKEEKDDFTRAMSLAEFHRTRRNPEQELKHLDEAEKIHPDHPDVIERRFRAALVAEDWERADRYVTKYRELNFDGTEGRIAAGRLALAKGTALRAEGNENQAAVELQTAAKLLKEGLEKQPSFSLGWVFLADAQLKMNQIEEGRAALERALDIDPTNGLACRAMTQIAIVRNDEPMEAKYLALAAKFLPNDPWVKQRLQLRREKDNPQQGILERENIRRQQPDNLENLVPLARLYGDPKVADYDQAVEAFQRALELSKDDLVLAREIAMFLGSEAVNRPADGEALLKRLLDNAESEPEAPAPGSEPRTPATGPNNRKALIAVYLGQFYEAQKTLSLADRHFRMAVSWDPSPDIFILGAEFYTRNNRSRDALEYYERALKQIDDNSESARSVRARMIGLLLTAGDLEMAQQKIDEFLQRYPDEAQGLVFVGAIHRMAGDIEKSKAAFDGFLAKRPDDALVLWQRGQLYMLMARWQAAIDDLTKSKVNKPDSFGYQHRIALASALIEVGRDQEAVAGLRSILNEHPDEQGVAEALVGVYLRLRPAQYADAEDLIVTYMRGHPKEVRWPTLLGQLGAQSADWKKAVRGYEAAAELARYGGGSIPALFSAYRHAGQPADIIRFSEEKLSAQVLDSQPAVLATLAWAYSQVKDEKKCFDTYDRALAMARDFPTQSMIVTEMAQVFGKEAVLERCQGRAESDPDNVSNLEVYAHLLFMNGKLEEAIKVCERIAGLATNDTDAVFAAVAQGMLLDGLGRYAEAKTKYEEALQRDPEQSVALNNLAYLLTERLDHPAEALPYARRAYRRSPNDPGVLDTLGWTLAKSNQLGEAVGMLLRALEIDRRNLAATYHLGLVHELRGELEEAKERLTSAKELAEAQGDNRTLPKIIEALNRLEKRG